MMNKKYSRGNFLSFFHLETYKIYIKVNVKLIEIPQNKEET